MTKSFNDSDKAELETWLAVFNVKPEHLKRQFTEAKAFAKLLHLFFPTIVDVNCLKPRTSLEGKHLNWAIFNNKTLKVLNLQLTTAAIIKIVQGDINVIQTFLLRIKQMVERTNRVESEKIEQPKRGHEMSGNINQSERKILTIFTKRKKNAKIVTSKAKMIDAAMYEKVRIELKNTDSKMRRSKKKIAHLKGLLKMKEHRIVALEKEVKLLSKKQDEAKN